MGSFDLRFFASLDLRSMVSRPPGVGSAKAQVSSPDPAFRGRKYIALRRRRCFLLQRAGAECGPALTGAD